VLMMLVGLWIVWSVSGMAEAVRLWFVSVLSV
jgi:hypothetical protein